MQLHLASPLAHGLDDGELAGALDGSAGSGLGGGAEGGASEDGGDHFDCFEGLLCYSKKVLSEVVVVVMFPKMEKWLSELSGCCCCCWW